VWVGRSGSTRPVGFDLLDVDRRFARFEEGLEIVTRLRGMKEPGLF
jgi:hypothetical protein